MQSAASAVSHCDQDAQEPATPQVDRKPKGFRERLKGLRVDIRKGLRRSQILDAEVPPPKYKPLTDTRPVVGHRYENIIVHGSAHFGDAYTLMHQQDIEAERLRRVSQFVASLKYAEMFSRLNNIKETSTDTYQWAFQNDAGRETDFVAWLKSARMTFLITGKAGSGKSTFMKFLFKSRLTAAFLSDMNGLRGQGAIIVFHSFYRAGTVLQRSAKGLIASMLYQLLTADPSLLYATDVARQLVAQMHLDDWSNEELRQILHALVSSSSSIICLFLDGLDEFGEDEDDCDLCQVLDDIRGWNTRFKLCLATRPIRHILRRYSAVPILNLHDLTEKDVRRFVSHELRSRVQDGRTAVYTDEEIRTLTDEICRRAQGVFIWVHYVLRYVCNGIRIDDDFKTLLRRIECLPSQIETLYSEMWSKENTEHGIHRDESCRIFALSRHFPMSLLQVTLALNTEHLYQVLQSDKPMTSKILNLLCEMTARRLTDGSAGLIECVDLDARARNENGVCLWQPDWTRISVQYFHRSVQTFLEETPDGRELMGRRSPDIDQALDRLVLESNLGAHVQCPEHLSYDTCIDFAFSKAWLTQEDGQIVNETCGVYKKLRSFGDGNAGLRQRGTISGLLIHLDPVNTMFQDVEGLLAAYVPMRVRHLLANQGKGWSPYYKGYLAMCAVLHNVTWWDVPQTSTNTLQILRTLREAGANLTSIQLYIQGNMRLSMRSPAARLLLKPCVYFLSQPSPNMLNMEFIEETVALLAGLDLKDQSLTIFFSQYYASPGLIASVSMYQFTSSRVSIGMVFDADDLYSVLSRVCAEYRQSKSVPYGRSNLRQNLPPDPREPFRKGCESLFKRVYYVTDGQTTGDDMYTVRELNDFEANRVQGLIFANLARSGDPKYPFFEESNDLGNIVDNPFPDIDLYVDDDDFRRLSSPLDPFIDVQDDEWRSKGVMRKFFKRGNWKILMA